MRRAFVLAELLVVMAILVVLAGLLLPILGQAKRSSIIAVDISNLHQIGIAASLYIDEYATAPRIQETIDAYVSDDNLWRSRLDPTPDGVGSEVCRNAHQSKCPHSKYISYPSLADFGCVLDPTEADLNNPAFGWLVNILPGEKGVDYLASQGNYHRLVLDGGVVHRVYRAQTVPNRLRFDPMMWFVDNR